MKRLQLTLTPELMAILTVVANASGVSVNRLIEDRLRSHPAVKKHCAAHGIELPPRRERGKPKKVSADV